MDWLAEQGTSTAKSTPTHGRTIPKIRIYADINKDDKIRVNESMIKIDAKTYSKGIFDHVFCPGASQEEVCTQLIPDLVDSVLAGQNVSFIAFGAKSLGKEERVYGGNVSRYGIAQNLLSRIIGNLEESGENADHQVVMSAVLVSQKDGTIIDLLSPFNTDPRRRCVRIVEDVTGIRLENESKIRVDTVEQAMFYLNTVVDHRLIQDEISQRLSHVFLTITIAKEGDDREERKLNFLDMGIGERNSSGGGLTMPGLAAIILALGQRSKNVPSRESVMHGLLKCALGATRLDVFYFTFGSKSDDNDNIMQLSTRISRSRSRGSGSRKSSACSSEKHRSEVESGSEFSAAETVIFVGPRADEATTPTTIRKLHRTSRSENPLTVDTSSPARSETGNSNQSIPPMLKGHTPFFSASLKLYEDLCSPPSTSNTPHAFGGNTNENREDFGITIAGEPDDGPKRSRSRYNLDDGKRKQIMQWMETSETPFVLFPSVDTSATEKEEIRECGILSHPLEDIIELEEESMKTSSNSASKKDHPLRILSKQNIEKMDGSTKDDELDQDMVASISSIKSHDILAKLEAMRNTASASIISATPSGTTMDMDLYRRASQLEEYAMNRVKELEAEQRKKKKSKMTLNCCQQSMMSSTSTVDWSAVERRKEEERLKAEDESRKDVLRERRERLKMEEFILRRERSLIEKELDDKKGLATTIARQFQQHFSLSPCRNPSDRHTSSRGSSTTIANRGAGDFSLPSTPTLSQRRLPVSPSKTPRTSIPNSHSIHQSLPRHTKLTNGSAPSAKKQIETFGTTPRKSSKSKQRERRNSYVEKEQPVFRSPYTQMTSPKMINGPATSSSGRGSDDGASSSYLPLHRKSKRQSYSASSGYESASGDYHIYTKKTTMFEKKTKNDAENWSKQTEAIRDRQKTLKTDLQNAKKLIGLTDDDRSIGTDEKRNLNKETLVDTLVQENKILEKRLTACRNHCMMVTTFI